MRDEGGLSQAMELARDVLFAATECIHSKDVAVHASVEFNSEMLALWCDLLRHMDQVEEFFVLIYPYINLIFTITILAQPKSITFAYARSHSQMAHPQDNMQF